MTADELEKLPRPAGSGRIVSFDLRHFDGALLREPHRLVTEPGVAVYIDGRLDRIEWTHARADGLEERHVAPASNVARIWTIRDPEESGRVLAPRELEDELG